MTLSISRLKQCISALRVEEAIGFWYLLLTILFAAYVNFTAPGMGEVTRIGIITIASISFYWLLLIRFEHPVFTIIRDIAPFLVTIAIFMNIHDMIRIINPNDIHGLLLQWDQSMFGVQPVVWIEKLYSPILTEWMSFSYLSYYWITLTLVAWLYAKEKKREFRVVMLAMMVSYYIGFLCYITFPAASPYLVIPEQFNRHVWSSGSFFSDLAQTVVSLSPERPRDAFPSLHTGVTLLTLIMAWRYNRKLFWIFLPMALTLPFATVYLRYHFVVDVLVGLFVPFIAMYLAPRIESWWVGFVDQERESLIE